MEKRNRKSETEGVELEPAMVLTGYAAMYNKPSAIMSKYGEDFAEIVMPGAFDKVLKDTTHEVIALCEHELNQPLAKRSVGTLNLSSDDVGLSVEIDLPDTSYAEDLIENFNRKNVVNMSFGWMDQEDRWDFSERLPVRRLFSVDLLEVSTTCIPAYEDSEILEIQVRSLREARAKIPFLPDMEDIRRKLKVRENELRVSPQPSK